MNLVLLIGTNPLPLYVSASFFMKYHNSLKRIYFVFSQQNESINQKSTKHFAENIKELLKRDVKSGGIEFIDIPLQDIGQGSSVHSALQQVLKECENELIHLNYTGGTKVMGVHSYHTLFRKENFEASYLSPHTFELISDSGKRLTSDLRKYIILNFDTILKLHGFYELKHETVFFEDANSQLHYLLNNNKLYLFTNDYKREKWSELKDYIKGKDDYLKNRDIIKQKIEKNISDIKNSNKYGDFSENIFLKILNSFPSDGYQFFSFKKGIHNDFSKLAGSLDYLDGKWFEQYIFNLVTKENKSKEIRLGVEFKKPEWTERNKFEIDVVMLYGYQLIGFSCTTTSKEDKKAILKQKGFEIILRTKQIGGDEAKAVLVSRANPDIVKELQEELEIETGSSNKSILVLGEKDIKEQIFLEKIKHFID